MLKMSPCTLSMFRNETSLLMKDPFWNGTQNGTHHYPAKPYIEPPRWTDCSDRCDGDKKNLPENIKKKLKKNISAPTYTVTT